MRTLECPKCSRRMEEGFLLDYGDHRIVRPTRWAEGAPEAYFWRFLKLRGKRKLEISAQRCGSCGYLELYANPPEGGM